MSGNKMLRSNGHFSFWGHLDIQKPIRVATEATHHHNFWAALFPVVTPILHDFQDGIIFQAATTPHVGQEQEAISKKPAEPPSIQINRSVEEAMQGALLSLWNHNSTVLDWLCPPEAEAATHTAIRSAKPIPLESQQAPRPSGDCMAD